MKKLVIIIHGSKLKKISIIQPLVKQYCKFFKLSLKNKNWPEKLKDSMQSKDLDVKVFHWSGGISETFSLNFASLRLRRLIKKSKDYNEIILFGKSLGGTVAEKAIKKMKIDNNINKLIYVATPHKYSEKRFPKKIEVINIYSSEDEYQKFGNIMLYFGEGEQRLSKARNICIRSLTHSEFNVNKFIKIHGKKIKLFDFYKKIILR